MGIEFLKICAQGPQSVEPPAQRIIRPALAALSLHVMPQIEMRRAPRMTTTFAGIVHSRQSTSCYHEDQRCQDDYNGGLHSSLHFLVPDPTLNQSSFR
jgi:hypothetical protein